MHQGNLALRILSIELSNYHEHPAIDIHVRIGDTNRVSKAENKDILNFNVDHPNQDLVIAVYAHQEELGSIIRKVNELLTLPTDSKKVIVPHTKFGDISIALEVKWKSKTSTQKYAGETTARVQGEMAALLTGDPQTALALHPAHRPYFMRLGFYYDVVKQTYAYVTSFPVLNRVARFNEHVVDRLTGLVLNKSLYDLDQKTLVPILSRLDDGVDTGIHSVLTAVVRGQNYVLTKKDESLSAVHRTVSGVWAFSLR